MNVRDETAYDPAFLCTGITATSSDGTISIVPVYGNNGCPSIAQTAKRTRFKQGTGPTPHFTRLIVLTVVDGFIFSVYFIFPPFFVLMKNQNASRPSQHPPVRGNLPCQGPHLFSIFLLPYYLSIFYTLLN